MGDFNIWKPETQEYVANWLVNERVIGAVGKVASVSALYLAAKAGVNDMSDVFDVRTGDGSGVGEVLEYAPAGLLAFFGKLSQKFVKRVH